MLVTPERGTAMAVTDAPRAIRIIVVLHYIAAFFWAVAGIIDLASGSFVGVIGLAIAVGVVVLARRLRTGVPWARTVTMVLQTLAFVTALVQLTAGNVNLNLLIAPAIVLTLAFDRECRAHFGLS